MAEDKASPPVFYYDAQDLLPNNIYNAGTAA